MQAAVLFLGGNAAFGLRLGNALCGGWEMPCVAAMRLFGCGWEMACASAAKRLARLKNAYMLPPNRVDSGAAVQAMRRTAGGLRSALNRTWRRIMRRRAQKKAQPQFCGGALRNVIYASRAGINSGGESSDIYFSHDRLFDFTCSL